MRLHHRHHRRAQGVFITATAVLVNPIRSEVGGHDDDGIAEIHRPSLTVGEAAVVEHLQQDVENLRMRLFDFVQQDHRVGLTPHRLGKVATFLVAHISRRGTDQARHRVLLHEFAHVDAHHLLFAVEEEFG